MINFISDGVKDFWSIDKIGIAKQSNKGIEYFHLNEDNIKRDDKMGEFLNRPLFILKSKK
jgi:hypothetical protein